MRKTRRPCRVCGSTTRKQLNRHHLLPKAVRTPGTQQITIKLCKDQFGCQVHQKFHQGDKEAASIIRGILDLDELVWMVRSVGSEWIDTIYPAE